MEEPPRLRFAPSPTGSLHVGGARTALYNWLLAANGKSGGIAGASFVLRVEDTDLARSTRESEESVLEDLRWLGLDWEEGPGGSVEGKYGPYRQSERNELYTEAARLLLESGKAYRCFSTEEELEASRAAQEAAGESPRYDGRWRDADPAEIEAQLAAGAPFTVRFRVPNGSRVVIEDAVRGRVAWDADSTVGDFILLRSSGVPVYNFCVSVDDAAMGITTVVRAEEHLTNTLRQGLVLDALGAPRPRYAHCSLILGEDKQKLSKRHGATSCGQFRKEGFLPDAMINYLSLLGWNDGTETEIFTREELVDAFSIDRVVKSPSIFDMAKLRWINGQHLKRMGVEEVAPLVREQLLLNGVLKEGAPEAFVTAATTIAKQMIETTRCASDNAREVLGYGLPASFADLVEGSEEAVLVKAGNFYGVSKALCEAFENNKLPLPDPAAPMDSFLEGGKGAPIVEDNQQGGNAYSFPAAYKTFMKGVAKDSGAKGKQLFHPLRLALTGEMSGQDVTKQLALVAMAADPANAVDNVATGTVTMEERFTKLAAFLDTIPEEFRAPAQKNEKKAGGKAPQESKGGASSDVAGGAPSEGASARPDYDGPPITALDIRVGVIRRCWEHVEADKLYCEEIDLGEESGPRSIASGLKEFYSSPAELEGRKVLVLCNLKKRNLVGFPSHGMVLCASNDDHTKVTVVTPPPDAVIGERVTVYGTDFAGEDAAPFAENKVGKKKVFEKIAPFLKTSEYGVPEFLGRPLMTSAGVCTTPLCDAQVS